MTNERAIELLHRISDSQFDGEHGDERREALEKAVRALKQNLVKESGDLVKDLVNDCISRKMAIDGKICIRRSNGVEIYDDYAVPVEYLEQLSSAQPEIIQCKDCKHHWTHRCMDSMPIERCDLGQTFYDAEVDYCSLAERREVTA